MTLEIRVFERNYERSLCAIYLRGSSSVGTFLLCFFPGSRPLAVLFNTNKQRRNYALCRNDVQTPTLPRFIFPGRFIMLFTVLAIY